MQNQYYIFKNAYWGQIPSILILMAMRERVEEKQGAGIKMGKERAAAKKVVIVCYPRKNVIILTLCSVPHVQKTGELNGAWYLNLLNLLITIYGFDTWHIL